MDPRIAATLGFRLMAVFFGVKGILAALGLVESLDLPNVASGFELARALIHDGLVAALQIGAALVLWRSAQRLAAAVDRAAGSSRAIRSAEVAFALLGTFFIVQGTVLLPQLVYWYDRARLIALVLLLAAVYFTAGSMLWRWANRFAIASTRAQGDEGLDRRQLAALGIVLIGIFFVVTGALELVTWLVNVGGDAFVRFRPRSTATALIPVLVRLGLGIWLARGGRALAERLVPADDAPAG